MIVYHALPSALCQYATAELCGFRCLLWQAFVPAFVCAQWFSRNICCSWYTLYLSSNLRARNLCIITVLPSVVRYFDIFWMLGFALRRSWFLPALPCFCISCQWQAVPMRFYRRNGVLAHSNHLHDFNVCVLTTVFLASFVVNKDSYHDMFHFI